MLEKIGQFVTLLNDKFGNEHRQYYHHSMGRKYHRIIMVSWDSDSAYCFIDRVTGDIYKAASWKAPAKIARGNIYNPDPLEGCNEYGMKYL